MRNERRVYGYYPVRNEMSRLDETNKAVTKIGFCVCLLTFGGYYLYKKVSNLSKEVQRMKETGK